MTKGGPESVAQISFSGSVFWCSGGAAFSPILGILSTLNIGDPSSFLYRKPLKEAPASQKAAEHLAGVLVEQQTAEVPKSGLVALPVLRCHLARVAFIAAPPQTPLSSV